MSRPDVRRVATGFQFTEGPVLLPDGDLLFSDIHGSRIYRFSRGEVYVYLDRPGMHPNGLALDLSGDLIICEHGRRCLSRQCRDGTIEVLSRDFEGRRLNSPNDVIVDSQGAIYFTDPPYGLAGRDGDPQKELPFNGLFRWQEGSLSLLCEAMAKPNGLALSPDEQFLYVANSDPADMYWNQFPLYADGSIGAPIRLLSLPSGDAGVPDGLKVRPDGSMVATGPGGILLLSAQGELAGRIPIPEIPANLALDPDGSLWVTARTSIYVVSRSFIEGGLAIPAV